ncbi:lipoprotein [Pseudomonas protegens]|uniref:lipoprotein n=1 Tax=Pseudomonas protegens TaxID=380021 RepID=UPI000643C3C5|nr:lipoprotein [Pseudomonas protegens]
MVKTLPLLIAVALLAGCSSAPKVTPAEEAGEVHKGCYQADWQAETAPVINKRLGPEGLEKYETPSKAREQGCP